jgi:predicted nuclease of predicted toxin-antitoxin system
VKLLLDEGLSPRLVSLLSDLYPGSESAIRNGLAGVGDRRILEHAVAGGFVLVSTDRDFVTLARQVQGAKVVILLRCDYPTEVAAGVLRRNAIRIGVLVESGEGVILLER